MWRRIKEWREWFKGLIKYYRVWALHSSSVDLRLNRAEERATELPFHSIIVRLGRASEPVCIDTLSQLHPGKPIARKSTTRRPITLCRAQKTTTLRIKRGVVELGLAMLLRNPRKTAY